MPDPRFTPHAHTLSSLFDSKWPMSTERYQRDYAWERDEVNAFIDDLISIRDKRRLAGPELQHFFGALVAIEHPRTDYVRSTYEIVDGQQRLATFSLVIATLIAAVRDLVDDLDEERRKTAENFIAGQVTAFLQTVERNQKSWADEPVFCFSMTSRDEEVFRLILEGHDLSAIDVSKRGSHRLLVDAAGILRDRLVAGAVTKDPAETFTNLVELRAAVADASEFIFISTTSEHDAHQLFTVLNDRGRRLEQADLLRVYTLMLASQSPLPLQQSIADQWDLIDANPRVLVDAFLRHHFASEFGERVASDAIYKRYRERLFGDAESPGDLDAKLILAGVKRLASSMDCYRPMSQGTWPFAEAEGPGATPEATRKSLLRLVRVMGSDRVLPLLLSAASLGRTHLAELVPSITTLEYRALVAGVEQNKISNAYMDIAALLRVRAISVQQAVAELSAWGARWATDKDFADGLARLRYGSSRSTGYIKHLLTTIDDHLDTPSGTVKASESGRQVLQVWDYGLLEDEHIYPQNPVGGVPPELREHIHRLGNQCFWGQSDNKAKEATNRLPTDAVKIGAYRASHPRLMKRVGNQLRRDPKWSVPEIDAREAWLVSAALKVFPLSSEARARALALPPVRERIHRWRAPGDVRTWLALADPAPGYGDDESNSYTCERETPATRVLAPCDILAIYRKAVRASPGAGILALPVRVTGRAEVDRIERHDDGRRRIFYRDGTYSAVDPAIDLASIADAETPGVGQLRVITRLPIEMALRLQLRLDEHGSDVGDQPEGGEITQVDVEEYLS